MSNNLKTYNKVRQEPADNDPYLEKHFRGHSNIITALDFNPSGEQILSSSEDNTLIIWCIRQSIRCYKFIGHTSAILAAKYSPDGNLIATGSRDRTVRLWTPRIKGECAEFKAHTSTVRTLDFSPDGTKLITGSDDKIIKLWQISRTKFLSSYVGHTNWVRCVRFSPTERHILSCSEDRTTRLIDTVSGQNIHTFPELKGHGVHVEFHPNGCVFAVALSNGNVKLYDIRTRKLQQHYQIHDEPLTQISFHPSGNYLLTASLDTSMKILDLLEGRPIYTLKGHGGRSEHSGQIKAVAFSRNGERFASGGADHNVLIWKTNIPCFTSDSYKGKYTLPKDAVQEVQKGAKNILTEMEQNLNIERLNSEKSSGDEKSNSSKNYVDHLTNELNSATDVCSSPSSIRHSVVRESDQEFSLNSLQCVLRDLSGKIGDIAKNMDNMNKRLNRLENIIESS